MERECCLSMLITLIVAPGGMPEMLVRLRPQLLVQFGFLPVDVLSAINTAYEGTMAAQTYDGNRIFGVSVILDPADRLDPEALGQLLLRNAEGNLVPLRELASITLETGRYAILHDGGRREQIVTCNVAGRALDSFVAQAQRTISALKLPAGTYIEFAGAAEARASALRKILPNSTIAAVLIFILLYFAFGNLRNLVLVLINIPFALVGGVLARAIRGPSDGAQGATHHRPEGIRSVESSVPKRQTGQDQQVERGRRK